MRCEPRGGAQVFLNGRWVGVHAEANELESILRELRRRKDLESEVPRRGWQGRIRATGRRLCFGLTFLTALRALSSTRRRKGGGPAALYRNVFDRWLRPGIDSVWHPHSDTNSQGVPTLGDDFGRLSQIPVS